MVPPTGSIRLPPKIRDQGCSGCGKKNAPFLATPGAAFGTRLCARPRIHQKAERSSLARWWGLCAVPPPTGAGPRLVRGGWLFDVLQMHSRGHQEDPEQGTGDFGRARRKGSRRRRLVWRAQMGWARPPLVLRSRREPPVLPLLASPCELRDRARPLPLGTLLPLNAATVVDKTACSRTVRLGGVSRVDTGSGSTERSGHRK